jgi:DNA-binding winged helix-turn-helix (wHTH) protein
LRRKLNDDPQQPQLIKTVRGGGYLFAAPIEAVRDRGQDGGTAFRANPA